MCVGVRYWESLRWASDYEGAWQSLGNALREQSYDPFSETQLDAAIQSHMTAVGYKPLKSRARYNLALTLHLVRKLLESGWARACLISSCVY